MTDETGRILPKPDDVFYSMNGWEELAVKKAFGHDLAGKELSGTMRMRALFFVLQKREGNDDMKARQAAFDATLNLIQNTFDMTDEGKPEAEAEKVSGED